MSPSPNPDIEIKLRRIERFSRILRFGSTLLLAFVILGSAFAAVAAATGHLTSITFSGGVIPISEVTSRGRVVLAIATIAVGLVIGKTLYHLRRLADNYTRREIFTTESARQIRQLGVSCLLWGVVKIAWEFLPKFVLPHPPATVNFSIDALLIGAVVVAISWIAEIATTLREENDLTI